MNNKNKILIGCLALLLALSVGYALFSDTITINGTATAKGEFSLTTTCDMDKEALEVDGMIDNGLITDVNISCEENVVDASATLGYPGSQKWFRIMVKNTGTIPAKLKKVVELNNPEEMICEKDNCSGNIWNIVKNQDDTNVVGAELISDIGWAFDYEEGSQGRSYSFDEAQFDAILDPEETAYFYIYMNWGERSLTPGEPLTATLNVQMDWEQVTVE